MFRLSLVALVVTTLATANAVHLRSMGHTEFPTPVSCMQGCDRNAAKSCETCGVSRDCWAKCIGPPGALCMKECFPAEMESAMQTSVEQVQRREVEAYLTDAGRLGVKLEKGSPAIHHKEVHTQAPVAPAIDDPYSFLEMSAEDVPFEARDMMSACMGNCGGDYADSCTHCLASRTCWAQCIPPPAANCIDQCFPSDAVREDDMGETTVSSFHRLEASPKKSSSLPAAATAPESLEAKTNEPLTKGAEPPARANVTAPAAAKNATKLVSKAEEAAAPTPTPKPVVAPVEKKVVPTPTPTPAPKPRIAPKPEKEAPSKPLAKDLKVGDPVTHDDAVPDHENDPVPVGVSPIPCPGSRPHTLIDKEGNILSSEIRVGVCMQECTGDHHCAAIARDDIPAWFKCGKTLRGGKTAHKRDTCRCASQCIPSFDLDAFGCEEVVNAPVTKEEVEEPVPHKSPLQRAATHVPGEPSKPAPVPAPLVTSQNATVAKNGTRAAAANATATATANATSPATEHSFGVQLKPVEVIQSPKHQGTNLTHIDSKPIPPVGGAAEEHVPLVKAPAPAPAPTPAPKLLVGPHNVTAHNVTTGNATKAHATPTPQPLKAKAAQPTPTPAPAAAPATPPTPPPAPETAAAASPEHLTVEAYQTPEQYQQYLDQYYAKNKVYEDPSHSAMRRESQGWVSAKAGPPEAEGTVSLSESSSTLKDDPNARYEDYLQKYYSSIRNEQSYVRESREVEAKNLHDNQVKALEALQPSYDKAESETARVEALEHARIFGDANEGVSHRRRESRHQRKSLNLKSKVPIHASFDVDFGDDDYHVES